jgi:hypothetical protein
VVAQRESAANPIEIDSGKIVRETEFLADGRGIGRARFLGDWRLVAEFEPGQRIGPQIRIGGPGMRITLEPGYAAPTDGTSVRCFGMRFCRRCERSFEPGKKPGEVVAGPALVCRHGEIMTSWAEPESDESQQYPRRDLLQD